MHLKQKEDSSLAGASFMHCEFSRNPVDSSMQHPVMCSMYWRVAEVASRVQGDQNYSQEYQVSEARALL